MEDVKKDGPRVCICGDPSCKQFARWQHAPDSRYPDTHAPRHVPWWWVLPAKWFRW